MHKIRLFTAALACAATMSVLAPSMRAGLWDKRTIVTFSGAVEVPGTVLQPGRYIMKLVDTPGDRHVVQFSNERENHVFATIAAIPAWRVNPSDKSVFTFYEAPVGQPQAMKMWFYPGDNFGQEFVYPKDRLAVLLAGGSRVTTAPVVVQQPTESAKIEEPAPVEQPAKIDDTSAPAPVPQETATAPQEEVVIAQNTAPPPPEVAPAPEISYKSLPKTASDFWEIGLIGLGSILAAGAVRIARRA